MGTGWALIDFGAFPGSSDTSFAVTGQTGITAYSFVEAWIVPNDTADHLGDEHLVETIKVMAGNLVPGTGFTIYGMNTGQINEPDGYYSTQVRDNRAKGLGIPPNPGKGTRIYGHWTVAWAWT